jgi:hypothetical protein
MRADILKVILREKRTGIVWDVSLTQDEQNAVRDLLVRLHEGAIKVHPTPIHDVTIRKLRVKKSATSKEQA